MPSDNNLIIRSLTETIKEPPKDNDELRNLLSRTYDLITRMNQDLNEVFNAVFDGPLPAVDGFELTRLNAAVLEGELPSGFNIAYLDEINAFLRGQSILETDDEVPLLQFGFTSSPTSYLRIGALDDGEFFLSQNAFFDGAVFDQDDAAIDSLIFHFVGGELSLEWWDNVLGDFRNTWTIAGREILCEDFADTAQLSFVLIDDNDVIHLGESAATDTTPAGHIAIPAKINTEIPLDGDADNDGIIIIDKTNKYLVFYTGGLRYRVAGVAYP